MKEGAGTREFYLDDMVTHIISDRPNDSNTSALLDCHILHVSATPTFHYLVNHFLTSTV